jgi:glycosyltransferase involved in cell wall biosynthesis
MGSWLQLRQNSKRDRSIEDHHPVSRVKVLYFHQHFSTPHGATGTRSYEMAKALIAAGHQVTMVCGSYQAGKSGLEGPFIAGRRSGIVEGINVIEYNLLYSNNDGFLRRTATFLSFALRSIIVALTHKTDLVFATTTPLTAGIPGVAARWLRNCPFVFEVRDLWPELPKAMGVITNPLVLTAMGILEWVSYHSATRCIALAPGIAAGIEARGVEAELISIVPNGSDFEVFGSDVRPWRPPGVEESDLLAVFTGSHGLANGLDAVLDAAAELRRRGRNDIKLVLIGDGSQKAALQKRVATDDLANVLFHAPVSKIRLAGLLASADLGLQILANVPAFYYGTSPNKFFDYLASGLPVLTNYPGWIAELVRGAECGFTVDADSPQAFADALEEAADNRGRLPEMGKRAAGLAREKFDRRVLAADLVAALEDTVAKGVR